MANRALTAPTPSLMIPRRTLLKAAGLAAAATIIRPALPTASLTHSTQRLARKAALTSTAAVRRIGTPNGQSSSRRPCPSRKMVKRKERKMAEQYVEQLAAARERIVADRRELADELAKPYER